MGTWDGPFKTKMKRNVLTQRVVNLRMFFPGVMVLCLLKMCRNTYRIDLLLRIGIKGLWIILESGYKAEDVKDLVKDLDKQ